VDAPRRHLRAKVKAFEPSPKEASVEQVITIGLDLAKYVFQAHEADAAGHTLFRKHLVRRKLLEFFAAQAPCGLPR
jgi:transposase